MSYQCSTVFKIKIPTKRTSKVKRYIWSSQRIKLVKSFFFGRLQTATPQNRTRRSFPHINYTSISFRPNDNDATIGTSINVGGTVIDDYHHRDYRLFLTTIRRHYCHTAAVVVIPATTTTLHFGHDSVVQ